MFDSNDLSGCIANKALYAEFSKDTYTNALLQGKSAGTLTEPHKFAYSPSFSKSCWTKVEGYLLLGFSFRQKVVMEPPYYCLGESLLSSFLSCVWRHSSPMSAEPTTAFKSVPCCALKPCVCWAVWVLLAVGNPAAP